MMTHPGPDGRFGWNAELFFVIGEDSIYLVANSARLPYLANHHRPRGTAAPIDDGAFTLDHEPDRIVPRRKPPGVGRHRRVELAEDRQRQGGIVGAQPLLGEVYQTRESGRARCVGCQQRQVRGRCSGEA